MIPFLALYIQSLSNFCTMRDGEFSSGLWTWALTANRHLYPNSSHPKWHTSTTYVILCSCKGRGNCLRIFDLLGLEVRSHMEVSGGLEIIFSSNHNSDKTLAGCSPFFWWVLLFVQAGGLSWNILKWFASLWELVLTC